MDTPANDTPAEPNPDPPLPVTALLAWYDRHTRDLPWRAPGRMRDPWSVWVSEAMLQQTQVKTVIPYYRRFMARFPRLEDLARASAAEALKLWEGLGYYRRCLNLQAAAREVVTRFNGRIPTDPALFRSLPGVGEYIAAAVLSISRGLRLPVVDGNVIRVITRFRAVAEDVTRSATRRGIAEFLARSMPAAEPGRFNQAVMELGALVCTPTSPACPACPLRRACLALSSAEPEAFPRRRPRRTVPEYAVSVAVILEKDRFLVQRRPYAGHLGGLWEFPGGKANTGESPEQALLRECREELGVDLHIVANLGLVRHAYTHFRIRMTVFVCALGEANARLSPGPARRWITPAEIPELPFPAANHKVFALLERYLDRAAPPP